MTREFASVSIKKSLLKKIDEVLESEVTTYSTRADLVHDAIRIRLRELGHNI